MVNKDLERLIKQTNKEARKKDYHGRASLIAREFGDEDLGGYNSRKYASSEWRFSNGYFEITLCKFSWGKPNEVYIEYEKNDFHEREVFHGREDGSDIYACQSGPWKEQFEKLWEEYSVRLKKRAEAKAKEEQRWKEAKESNLRRRFGL